MKLYHATYGPLLQSIMEKGLIPRYYKVWDDCEWGIYLANFPYEAESFCEIADSKNVPDEWLDDIVILEIDISKLEPTALCIDPHVYYNEKVDDLKCYMYKNIVPPTCIKQWNGVR